MLYLLRTAKIFKYQPVRMLQVPAASGNTTAPTASSKTTVDASGQGLIKGNINSKGEKKYHLPGGAFYDKTNPEALFKTEEEARAAGYRASKT